MGYMPIKCIAVKTHLFLLLGLLGCLLLGLLLSLLLLLTLERRKELGKETRALGAVLLLGFGSTLSLDRTVSE